MATKKKVKAGSVEEAKKSLGAEKVVSTGRGEFTKIGRAHV